MFRITKTHEFEDAMYYRAICDCSDKYCDLELGLEIDGDFEDMTLTLSGTHAYSVNHYGHLNFFERRIEWVKDIFKLIFTGRIEVGKDFILHSDKQITDFAESILEGKRTLNSRRKSNKPT